MARRAEPKGLHDRIPQSGERRERRWFQLLSLLLVQAWWLPLFER
jgi:hypothetical protein